MAVSGVVGVHRGRKFSRSALQFAAVGRMNICYSPQPPNPFFLHLPPPLPQQKRPDTQGYTQTGHATPLYICTYKTQKPKLLFDFQEVLIDLSNAWQNFEKSESTSLFEDESFFYILIAFFFVLLGVGGLWHYFVYLPRQRQAVANCKYEMNFDENINDIR